MFRWILSGLVGLKGANQKNENPLIGGICTEFESTVFRWKISELAVINNAHKVFHKKIRIMRYLKVIPAKPLTIKDNKIKR